MREWLLDEFVGHIEAAYGLTLTELARDIVRKTQSNCRGERLQIIARCAAEQLNSTPAAIMESFGSRLAAKCCGRPIPSPPDADAESLFGQLQELAGEDVTVTHYHCHDGAMELIIHYRDAAGCGDVIAGLLREWSASLTGEGSMRQQDLSAVPGSHVRFHIQTRSD